MIQVIPAIDLIDGKCVRLTQGDYARRKTYDADPLETACRIADAGLRRLHLVDLEGAKGRRPVNLAVLERIAAHTPLQIDFGGGIKDRDALRSVLDAGATWAVCGSIAALDPATVETWMQEFGAERFILGADLREGRIATHGWTTDTALKAEEFLDRFGPGGVRQAIVTDIARDGMLCGIDIGLYTGLQAAFSAIDILVSGGIAAFSDLERLEEAGLRGVIVGKALHEGKITLKQLSRYAG